MQSRKCFRGLLRCLECLGASNRKKLMNFSDQMNLKSKSDLYTWSKDQVARTRTCDAGGLGKSQSVELTELKSTQFQLCDADFNSQDLDISVCSISRPAQFTVFCNPSIKSSNFGASKDYGKWVNDGTGNPGPGVATTIHHQARAEPRPEYRRKINFAFCIRNWQYPRFMGERWQKLFTQFGSPVVTMEEGGAVPPACYRSYLCFKLSLWSFRLYRIKSKVATE